MITPPWSTSSLVHRPGAQSSSRRTSSGRATAARMSRVSHRGMADRRKAVASSGVMRSSSRRRPPIPTTSEVSGPPALTVGHVNRLAAETSPYLRQHADNPVHWYAWGDEAFAAAKLLDKPILLSVGYSSCHWCHVMAHESFEDAEVAGLMNDLFVNVKVDREERPDVDEIYMEAVQALTGQGGWPMTVFLTPDGRPFFAGTYFPRTPHGRMIAFPDLCQRIGELWRTRRQDIDTQAGQLTGALGRTALVDPADTPPGADALASAVTTLRQQHDDTRGGFGGPPKFPQAMSLDLLLRQLARPSAGAPEAAPDIRAVVETSLDAMAAGGIFEHVGGGLGRYSVH